MLLPSGRWNGHCRVTFVIVADVIAMGLDLISILVLRCLAEPHPKCEADGTCLCFY